MWRNVLVILDDIRLITLLINVLSGDDIPPVEFPTEGCVGPERVIHTDRVPLDKGKGIDLGSGKNAEVDKGKGKGIQINEPTSVPPTFVPPTAQARAAVAAAINDASDIRIMSMLHAGDAPPYFDDPIEEGKIFHEIVTVCKL